MRLIYASNQVRGLTLPVYYLGQYSPTALEFRQSIGGEQAIYEYCEALAKAGGDKMAMILGTETLDPKHEYTGSMVLSISCMPSPTLTIQRIW